MFGFWKWIRNIFKEPKPVVDLAKRQRQGLELSERQEREQQQRWERMAKERHQKKIDACNLYCKPRKKPELRNGVLGGYYW